jgi:uncharacterized protein (TIGR02452 family)
MKPNELVKVAEETISILEEGLYVNHLGEVIPLDDLVDYTLDNSQYYPELGWQAPTYDKHIPNIYVTEETTAQAAKRIVEMGKDVVVLNFASARRPGGGWLEGARAQEEDLARCSALGYCLEFQKQFYLDNIQDGTGIYTDGAIYSPQVPFFRDHYCKLTEQPYLVSVITSPAPNVNKLNPGEEQLLPVVLRFRAKRILEIAAKHGHKNIVLGAWGCGVFGNEPLEVAKAFKYALDKVPAFETVCFAIYDNRKDQPVLKTFKDFFDVV